MSRPLREGVGRNRQESALEDDYRVALYARAWVEIPSLRKRWGLQSVALYARAWVEIKYFANLSPHLYRRPLREGVGRNMADMGPMPGDNVALYARAWVEIKVAV